jgi:hypothetical protein
LLLAAVVVALASTETLALVVAAALVASSRAQPCNPRVLFPQQLAAAAAVLRLVAVMAAMVATLPSLA